MRKFFITLLAAVVASGAPAFAADMAVKATPKSQAAYVPDTDPFTGFAIGGTVGYAWNNTGNGDIFSDQVLATSLTTAPQGFAGGVFADLGTRFQTNFYAGIEADFSLFNLSGTAQMPGVITVNSKDDTLGTVRARFGVFLLPNVMVYGTGGLAYGDPSGTFSLSGGESASASSTKLGWAAGAGIEGAVSAHWLLRLEWLHADLGSVSVSAGAPPATVTFTPSFVVDTVRAGVAYKF